MSTKTTDTAANRNTAAVATPSRVAAVPALLLGAFLLFGVGFANADQLHNAAHDSRHSLAFPCH